MILDTSFLVDVLRGWERAAKKTKEIEESGEDLFITTISVFELWQGLYNAQPKELEKVNRLLSGLETLNLESNEAKLGGKIHSALRKKGRPIEPQDSMIAGIALHHNQAVLTKDEYFSRIKDLKVEYY